MQKATKKCVKRNYRLPCAKHSFAQTFSRWFSVALSQQCGLLLPGKAVWFPHTKSWGQFWVCFVARVCSLHTAKGWTLFTKHVEVSMFPLLDSTASRHMYKTWLLGKKRAAAFKPLSAVWGWPTWFIGEPKASHASTTPSIKTKVWFSTFNWMRSFHIQALRTSFNLVI